MPQMFGLSRRRTKLGRLKVHLAGDSSQATKSPARPRQRTTDSSSFGHSNAVTAAATASTLSDRSDDLACRCSSSAFDLHNCQNWTALSTEGERPVPRFDHAAAVVGSRMVIVGGDSGQRLLNDTKIFSLEKLTWASASPKPCSSPKLQTSTIPPCKGHCLVPWGKAIFLVGGTAVSSSDRISVWSFDMETESWSHLEAKGDVPVARSGHTVIRAGSVLILFGGEDAKGKKYNDLHMFDMKSLMWLPLHHRGTRPSPRSYHVAALYDGKILLVFGGRSKSKSLNDLHSLDFETMAWSRVKTCGLSQPSPRSGCCGALCGTKWYIAGGGSKKKGHAETFILDVRRFEWSECVTPPNTSVTTNKGFSMVPLHCQDKTVLVAFGGNRKEPSNKVEIMTVVHNEHSVSRRSALDIDVPSYDDYSSTAEEEHPSSCKDHNNSNNAMNRTRLLSGMEQNESGRKSFSDTLTPLQPKTYGSMSLHKQFYRQEPSSSLADKLQKPIEDGRCRDGDNCTVPASSSHQRKDCLDGRNLETAGHADLAALLSASTTTIGKQRKLSMPGGFTDDVESLVTRPEDVYQLYEAKLSNLMKRNLLLEQQLTASLASKDAAEKTLCSTNKAKEEAERRLAESAKEVELLNEKLAGLEIAQEEANSLSNAVHADNLRLEHDVAFLKAILDDTQKELHSTRGVLAGERARAFQLQVEIFHLKQRLQVAENRETAPRKPCNL